MEYLYWYIWVYIGILILVSLLISKWESSEDFLISWRDRNWFQLMFSKFSASMWVSWLIVYTWYAYQYGVSMYAMLLGFLFGYMLFAFWVVPKVFSLARKNKFYTQWDFVYHQTKSHIWKTITNYYSCVIQFTWLLATFIGWAKIMSSIWLISYEAALVFTILTVSSYILVSWYKAVVVTDVFQWIVILVLFFIITGNIVGGEDLQVLLTLETKDLDIASTVWILLYGTLSILALSDRYQLMYAAKEQKDITKGMFFTFIPITLIGIITIFLGLFMYSQNSGLDPDLVFLQAITSMQSTWLISLAVVMLFAGLMSSADTYIYSISSHIVLERNNSNQSENITDIRIMTIIVVLIAWVISYVFRDIIWVTIIWAGLSLIMSFPMIYIIRWWQSASRFLWSLFWGGIWLILWIIVLWLEPSIALTVLIWWGLGLLKK